MAQRWEQFCREPGPLVIGAVQGASCFGPAYEFAMMAVTDLRKRRIRDRVPITFVTSEPYIGHLGLGGVGDTKSLLESSFRDRDVKWIVNAKVDRITVPGSLEIPAAIAIAVDAARKRRRPYDGAVALGCVIRGETLHFEIVSNLSARGLMDLAVARLLPIGNGIITVDTEAQAWARARKQEQDKGGDAARAALAMVALKRRLAGR